MVRTSLIVSLFISCLSALSWPVMDRLSPKSHHRSPRRKTKKEGTRVLEVLDILFGKDEGKKK